MNRREFFRTAAGATAAAALLPLLERSRAFAGATDRSYSAGRFALMLDGAHAGYLESVEGGSTSAEVITARCGTGMSKGMYDWIKSAFDNGAMRKNGSIDVSDFKRDAASSREFTNALITEVSFPALDGASKDAAYMTLKIQPESVRQVPASSAPASLPPINTKQKKWLCSNFRLSIGDLDCSKVNKVDAFTIKQGKITHTLTPVYTGTATKEPAQVEYPNMHFTFNVPIGGSGTFSKWHEDFVTKGNNGPAMRKSGSIIFLDSDMKTELFRLTFKGLGIAKVSPKVELSMENVSFSYSPAALG